MSMVIGKKYRVTYDGAMKDLQQEGTLVSIKQAGDHPGSCDEMEFNLGGGYHMMLMRGQVTDYREIPGDEEQEFQFGGTG